jgi:beta-galactosidase/beta-glucuronidase
VQQLLIAEAKAMVEEYKNTPGLLLFLLGNENNYGLWDGAETIPLEDRESTIRHMLFIFNDSKK